MTIVLRSTKGANLTPAEVDGNFTDLDGRVTTLETSPPDANSVANITFNNSTMTVVLDDATEFTGTLPTAVFAWRGEWTGATVYFTNDVVVVTGDGVYLVLQDHTSEATFSAAESDSDGDYYFKMIGAGADGADGATGATGPQGPAGASGGQWFTDAGTPGAGLGADGDFYLDQGTSDGTGEGDVYQHQGTAGWTLQFNILGPQGATGATGPTGPEGPQGPTGAGSTVIVEEGGTPVGDPASNLNFDADDFNVVEDTSGTVTVTLAGGAAGGWALAGLGNTATGIWDQAVDGSAANVDFTGLAGATEILILAEDVTKAVSGFLMVQTSDDDGATFDAVSGDYHVIQGTGAKVAVAGLQMHEGNASAARSGVVHILGADISGSKKPAWASGSTNTAAIVTTTTSPINAVRVLASAGGNLTGGTIMVLAR